MVQTNYTGMALVTKLSLSWQKNDVVWVWDELSTGEGLRTQMHKFLEEKNVQRNVTKTLKVQ